jgi:hypothetical protein
MMPIKEGKVVADAKLRKQRQDILSTRGRFFYLVWRRSSPVSPGYVGAARVNPIKRVAADQQHATGQTEAIEHSNYLLLRVGDPERRDIGIYSHRQRLGMHIAKRTGDSGETYTQKITDVQCDERLTPR